MVCAGAVGQTALRGAGRTPVQSFRTWSAVVLLALAGCSDAVREPTEGRDGGAIPTPDGGEPADGGSARSCGGLAGTTCPAGEYCFYSIAQACGAADATGVCVPRPNGCVFTYRAVCGCDGNTYSDSCSAAACGVSVASEVACPSAGACREGEIKKVDCNTCTCINGLWGCTLVACPPCDPGQTREGQGWNTCVCNSKEQWACTGEKCLPPPMSKPCAERDTCDPNEFCEDHSASRETTRRTCDNSGAARDDEATH